MPTERQLTVDQACREIAELRITRRIDEVIVHHTWKPTAADYRGIETVCGVRRYHQQVRGWSDNGYHVMVGPQGQIFFCRPFARSGGHTLGHNAHSIGISYIADFDAQYPETYAGLAAGQLVVAALCERFELGPEDVFFHSDVSSKTCPGSLMDRKEYRKAVKRFMNGKVKLVVLTGDERPDFVIAISEREEDWQELFGDEDHIAVDLHKHIADQGKVYMRKREGGDTDD